jgi:surface antigen
LRNARAKGHKTGSTPTVGSIVSLNGRGYNPRYGHVAIVMDIKDGYIYVSDMNYRKLYEVTYRKIPVSSSSIT